MAEKQRRKGVTPEKGSGRSTARRVVLGVVLMLAAFAGINYLAGQYLAKNTTNLGYKMVHAKWTLLESIEPPVDWLILGDSSGAHGMVPEAWDEVMGGRSANLAILANLLVVNDAWMLQRYIERNGPPKNVVLVHAFDVWHRQPNSTLIGKIPQPWGFWERVQPTLKLKADDQRKLFMSRFLPLYAESGTLKKHLKNWGPPRKLNFSMTPRGFIPGQPHSRGRLRRDFGRTQRFLRKNRTFKVSDANARALTAIGKLSDKHGFPVYITNGPQYQAVAEMSEFKDYSEQALARLRRMTRRYKNVHVVPDLATYPFKDLEAYCDHVIPSVAPRHTATMAQIVKGFGGKSTVSTVERDYSQINRPKIERSVGKDEVTLLFGGDTSFARGIAQSIERKHGGDAGAMLAQMKPLMSEADLSFLNVECVLSDSDAEPANKRWKIRAPTRYAKGLSDIGVDIVSVSNNHTLDFGQQGFKRTLETLDEIGVGYVGVQHSGVDTSQHPVIAQVGQSTFGFLAYTDISKWREPVMPMAKRHWPKPGKYRLSQMLSDIRAAKKLVDHVVVSVHWGREYSMLHTEQQTTAARSMIDAGAELIIGHHPHVPRMVETYNGGLIAYSLGDFMFDKRTPYKTVRNRRRFVLSVKYTAGKRAGFELVPIHSLDDHAPYPKPDLDVSSWIAQPVATSYDFADMLPAAKVERFFDGEWEHCSDWTHREPTKRNNGYLKWLVPRWKCRRDKQRPWWTVAVSGDRSAEIYRRSIWAHPHPEGPVRLTFSQVPLSAALTGFAGVPDWPVELAKGELAPFTFEVTVDGNSMLKKTIEHRRGWHDFVLDTQQMAGKTADVVITVDGGAARETGFTFNLMVTD